MQIGYLANKVQFLIDTFIYFFNLVPVHGKTSF